MNTTRKDIRNAFKVIGYTVSFKRNTFNDSLCNLAFKSPEMLKPIVVAPANCYSVETIEKHKKAFDLANSYNGDYLTDTEQKIV
jgi:hypothetical protein